MKTQTLKIALCTLISSAALGGAALTGSAVAGAPSNPTLEDIEATLGSVPSFFEALPPQALPGAWADFKAVQLSGDSAIPAKFKELIGLGVSAQIPCDYCTYFHGEIARLNGASEAELAEAATLAGQTRRWSTILNGNQVDMRAFEKEADSVIAYLKSGKKRSAKARKERGAVRREIANTLGIVPSFLDLYPPAGLPGVWQEMRDLQLGETEIPGKYKQLLEVAVASQIPCTYCTYFHTKAAKLMGATDAELREAVAVAAEARHWSTFLNGARIDAERFRVEVADVVERARRARR